MRALLPALLLCTAACYRPGLGDCQVHCSSASPSCPSGLSCDVAEGFCQSDMAFDCSSIPRPDAGPPADGGPPPGTTAYASLSVGEAHACAIRASDHTLWCWGFGTDGALGDGQFQTSARPVHVGGDTDWLAVSAGNDYTCGIRGVDLTSGGDLYCWGLNNNGQVDSDQRGTNFPAPTAVSAGKKWKAVSAGRGATTCAIDSDGHLFCGGENDLHQAGTGVTADFVPLTLVSTTAPTTWKLVASSYSHVCAIQTSGELDCWGGNNNAGAGGGEDGVLGTGDNINHTTPARVGTASDWLTVSSSAVFNCGIRGAASSGNLYCWGRDSGNLGRANGGGAAQTTPALVGSATTDNDWKAIASDGRHSCGVRDAGGKDRLYCFGLGEDGTLGLGERQDHPTPTRVDDVSSWSQVGAGDAFACGLRTDGAVLCWGLDDDGQLGDGVPSVEVRPVRVGDQTGWSSVALGQYHTCGLRGNELSCWGMNEYGQLGLGAGQIHEEPAPQIVAGDWKYVAAGNYHTCAIDNTADALLCWGSNYDGALGTGDTTGTDAPHSVPKKVSGATVPPDWLAVDAGLAHTCAVAGARTLWCWGSDYTGQLGLGTNHDGTPNPLRVGTGVDWYDVAAGTAFTCALQGVAGSAPKLWCFGEDDHHQTGRTVAGDPYVPTQVDTGTLDLSSIVATGEHTCALIGSTNELRCWGGNGTGALGLGADNFDDSAALVAPMIAGPWLSVGVGHEHTCAVSRTDGTMWCWGGDTYGQLGDGAASGSYYTTPRQVSNDTDWTAVYGGWEHTCAIKTDGSLWCWGRNSRGQVGNGQSSSLVPTRIADPPGA